jgi:hypothetical protein
MSPLDHLRPLAALLLLAASAARAEGPAAQPATPAAATAAATPATTASPTAGAAVRVRASHRVDVVAPGERVETVIDRLRRLRPGPGGGAAQRPPQAGPAGRLNPGAAGGPGTGPGTGPGAGPGAGAGPGGGPGPGPGPGAGPGMGPGPGGPPPAGRPHP